MAEPPTQFQLRVKAGAAVATAGPLALLLLFDWDKASGGRTVFSSIRPTLRAAANWAYGVEQQQQQKQQQETQQQQQQGRQAAR